MGQSSTPSQNQTPNRGIPLPLVHWRGFTLQMFLFLLLPLTVLLLAIVFVSQSLHHNEMRALVGERDLRAVRAAANNLSDEIDHRATALAMLAFQTADTQVTSESLDQAAQAYGMDGGLALFDGQGRLVARSGNAVPEILDLPQVQNSIDRTGSPEENHAARLSPPTRTTGERWLLFGLAQSDGSDSRLVGAFSPESLAREALSGVAGDQSAFMLVSAQGDVLFASGAMEHSGSIATQPGVADVLRGESGVNYMSSSDGMMAGHSGEHVIAFSPVPPFGWGLVLEEPWEQSAGPLLSVTQSAPLILAPVLLLAMLALWFGIRQIIQPLQSLESRAGRLAAGDFAAIRAPVGGIDEIQNLQDKLVSMAGALQSAQQALHSYIGALTAGLETERRSLARELHDDTLQALIALNQHLQLALLRTTDPTQRQPLLDLQARVTETIANLRQAIGGLRPIYLEDLGLVAALGMLAKNNASTAGLGGPSPRVEFEVSGPERRLSSESELAFYRIAQEALNNALHHAQATEVQIALAFEEESTHLSICDNGKGFSLPPDPGAFAHHGHYGLLGMRERADLVGAEMQIETAHGKGTKVRVRLPLVTQGLSTLRKP